MTDPKFIGPPKKLFQSYTMPKAKTARVAIKALRVAKFARAATPIGLATVAVTSIKKRDPKAVKREIGGMVDYYRGVI